MLQEIKTKLKHTSNANIQDFIGCYGVLRPNKRAGWDFAMDNGKVISTTAVAPNTVLGSLEHPSCKEFSFQTQSGSLYVFEICNREGLLDYCTKAHI